MQERIPIFGCSDDGIEPETGRHQRDEKTKFLCFLNQYRGNACMPYRKHKKEPVTGALQFDFSIRVFHDQIVVAERELISLMEHDKYDLLLFEVRRGKHSYSPPVSIE